jgi:hypothetical protein
MTSHTVLGIEGFCDCQTHKFQLHASSVKPFLTFCASAKLYTQRPEELSLFPSPELVECVLEDMTATNAEF